jgi:hypothetical protein
VSTSARSLAQHFRDATRITEREARRDGPGDQPFA